MSNYQSLQFRMPKKGQMIKAVPNETPGGEKM